MIRPVPYRRPAFDCDRSWCDFPGSAVSLALACHKGNASQQQSNEQNAAQTGGVVIKGSGNDANSTGNQLVITTGADTTGWGWLFGNKPTNSTTNVAATINSGVSAADLNGFVGQLVGALSPKDPTAAQDGTPAPTLADPNATPATAIPRAVIIGGVAVVLAFIVGVVFLFTRKPKHT